MWPATTVACRCSPVSVSAPVRATTSWSRWRRPAFGQTALVFGQMDEPPGTRLRVALSALTMAEYFRDVQKQDVLLFIDNIFRFTQAGLEVSTLLGRMPSAVGYQPIATDEMGVLQERITFDPWPLDHLDAGDLRARGRLHRPGPGDDLRPPGRDHRARVRSPARYLPSWPWTSTPTSRILDRRYIAEDHYDTAVRASSRSSSATRSLQDIIAILGIDEPSGRGQDPRQPRPSHPAVPVAEHLRRQAVHRHRGLDRAAGRHHRGVHEDL